MGDTQKYRCHDCSRSFPEDEVDILRHSPIDKGYLACMSCIEAYRESQRQYERDLPRLEWENDRLVEIGQEIIGPGWMKTRMREAEYKAQDWEAENLPPEPVIHYHERQVPMWAAPFVYCLSVFWYLMTGE